MSLPLASLVRVLSAVAFAVVLGAQTAQIPFSFAYQIRDQSNSLGIGGVIAFPTTTIGQTVQATLRITSQSSAQWTIRRVGISGAGFSVGTVAGAIPAGAQTAFPITFAPTVAAAARAVLTLTLDGPDGQTVTPVFSLNGTGGEETVVAAFLANASANPVTLSAGDTIRMAVVAAGNRQTASIILSNRGSSAVPLQEIRVSGNDAFEVGGLPLLPANLGPGGELRFFLTFAPTGRGPFEGELSLNISGAQRVYPVRGELSSSSFRYERITDSSAQPVEPDTALEFPAISVGAPRSIVRLRVRNAGSLAGRINTLSVTGSGFQLVDPPGLPVSLGVGESVTISIGFAPKEPGPVSGRLAIDDAGFELSGNALGGRFSLTLSFSETQTDIFEGVAALLPNTPAGGKLPFSITVRNSGNQAAPVTLVSVSGPGFLLVRTPPLPARLEPGASMTIDAAFAPTAVGVAEGKFQLDQLTIPLRAAGNAPPAVPALRFLNVAAKMEALQQPDLGMELAAAYSYDVAGKLTVSFAAENFLDDPAVQFVSGSRSIDFRIPAGATRAVFPNGKDSIRMQTGSSAGIITLSAAMTVAGVAVTSNPAPSFDIAIAAGAPVIRSLQIGTRSTNRVDIVITGASTARAVSRIQLVLNPAPRSNLQTTKLTVNVEPAFNTWYQSSQSRALGSQFTATVRLDIAGDIRAIDSVSATLENAKGASAVRKVSLSQAE
ncbi:MAG: choice-of-anchor D domain-containing protein [Bryobacteraceae bacterium]